MGTCVKRLFHYKDKLCSARVTIALYCGVKERCIVRLICKIQSSGYMEILQQAIKGITIGSITIGGTIGYCSSHRWSLQDGTVTPHPPYQHTGHARRYLTILNVCNLQHATVSLQPCSCDLITMTPVCHFINLFHTFWLFKDTSLQYHVCQIYKFIIFLHKIP